MKIEPSKADWTFAKSIRDEFKRKPGSQHIASEFALAYLGALLNKVQPDSVLEFGAGIGTVTYFLMKHPANIGHVTTTEDHPYCLEQFAANIPEDFSGRYDLIVDDDDLVPGQRQYDLVIVDNTVSKQGCALFDRGLVCFVEGAREGTRQYLQSELAVRGFRCDLINYNRGRRGLSIALGKGSKSGIPYPKIRFPKSLKGCWIGVVRPWRV